MWGGSLGYRLWQSYWTDHITKLSWFTIELILMTTLAIIHLYHTLHVLCKNRYDIRQMCLTRSTAFDRCHWITRQVASSAHILHPSVIEAGQNGRLRSFLLDVAQEEWRWWGHVAPHVPEWIDYNYVTLCLCHTYLIQTLCYSFRGLWNISHSFYA